MNFEDIMSYNSPYNLNNINSLIDDIQNNNIVPYIGAGMSVLFDGIYPTWGVFLEETFDGYCKDDDKEEFLSLDFENRADFLYNSIGKLSFSDHLTKVFGSQHLQVENDKFYNTSSYLLPKIFDNSLLITTNYDKVIETCYRLHGKTLTVAHPGHFEALNNALRSKGLLLYKIHGDISEPIDTIILTKAQYDKAYSNEALINSLKQIYVSKSILFLGCSLSKDRPISILCDNSRSGMSNYAIIPCKEDAIRSRRIELENDFFTKSIIYPDEKHECVFEILNYIESKLNHNANKATHGRNLHLNDQWFINQNTVQIKNLGDRYLPELNIKLDIANTFDALGQNENFHERFKKRTDQLITYLNLLKLPSIQSHVEEVVKTIKSFLNNTEHRINAEQVINALIYIHDKVSAERFKVSNERSANEESKKEYYKLLIAEKTINDYLNYMSSKEIQVVDNPFILLHGEGGIGKSHIIADVITQRINDGKKSLLFLGQHFKTSNPTNEMMASLNLSCTFEELLQALNNIGMKEKNRILIFIDALNEGNGKTIWSSHLAGIVEQINRFPWLGCVVSIRTDYVDVLFEDNTSLRKKFISVKHNGFFTLEHDAVKKYFEYYGITYFDTMFLQQEFRNPLFLRLFCEGVKNQTVNLDRITFSEIYNGYLNAINSKISVKCGYSKRINAVQTVINEMVLYKYQRNSKNNFIQLNDCIEIVANVERKYNITASLLDELMSNGILTQNIDYDKTEYVYITYEKLEDYLYAKILIKELELLGTKCFKEKYSEILYYPDIVEALSIVLAEQDHYELFDIFEDESDPTIIDAFCHSLKWRKHNNINDTSIKYIYDVVLNAPKGLETLFEELLILAPRIGHALNAEKTVDYILKYKMSDRDAIFIPLFDNLYFEEGSAIHRLLDWCLSKADKKQVSNEIIRLTAIMLSIFLISSNNPLRDKVTYALVNLLTGKIDVLLSVMDKYKNIDDPYVYERLYAVAFGCIVREQSVDKIESLALYVYDTIFSSQNVYPNILLRDYAKNIIDYAKHKVGSTKLKSINVQPPYKSQMPLIPSDEEIEKFRLNYESENFQKHHWSQNKILNSMNVEYTRSNESGGYGDFERYVFQRYFSNWEDLDYNDLKNIAVKKVFDLGYDVEKHGVYDSNVRIGRKLDNLYERIGKKYQWIAFYELAAQVSDNYQLPIHYNEYGDTVQMYCLGSFEPYIRNIDPTISFDVDKTSLSQNIHKQIYSIPAQDNYIWLETFDDFPDMNKLLEQIYNGSKYMLLNGWYSWKEDNIFDVIEDKYPYKDMWIQMNSYIVKESQIDEYIIELSKSTVDFMGRWATEPHENLYLFNREYYWSEGFKFFDNPYYCGEEWVDFESWNSRINKIGKVLIPAFIYSSERSSDSMAKESTLWYKPCNEIYTALDLSYRCEDTVLYDKQGNIICFDSRELLHEDIGFFIDSNALNKFLTQKGYSIFWTVLAEKRIMQDSWSDNGNRFPMPHLSGIIYYNSNGKLVLKHKVIDS